MLKSLRALVWQTNLVKNAKHVWRSQKGQPQLNNLLWVYKVVKVLKLVVWNRRKLILDHSTIDGPSVFNEIFDIF
jgi:hypothetical protein